MISKKQVQHIANLARIKLTERENEKFTKELSSILDYVEQLKKVDTSKVEGISQIAGLESVVREDEQQKIKDRKEKIERILKQAPRRKGDYYKVPKILE